MTPDERAALIEVKIERAKQHILDLQSNIKTFRNSKPYEIVSKIEPKTIADRLHCYAIKVDPVPYRVSAVAGDAIHNLRTVLDHIAQQLFVVGLQEKPVLKNDTSSLSGIVPRNSKPD